MPHSRSTPRPCPLRNDCTKALQERKPHIRPCNHLLRVLCPTNPLETQEVEFTEEDLNGKFGLVDWFFVFRVVLAWVGEAEYFRVIGGVRGRGVEDEGLATSDAVAIKPGSSVREGRRMDQGTYRRKKWNRSVVRRNDFFPLKKAPRALDTSGVEEYSEMEVKEKSSSFFM